MAAAGEVVAVAAVVVAGGVASVVVVGTVPIPRTILPALLPLLLRPLPPPAPRCGNMKTTTRLAGVAVVVVEVVGVWAREREPGKGARLDRERHLMVRIASLLCAGRVIRTFFRLIRLREQRRQQRQVSEFPMTATERCRPRQFSRCLPWRAGEELCRLWRLQMFLL